MRKPTMRLVSRCSHSREAVATIPMPTGTYIIARVQMGAREWKVRDYGDSANVVSICDPAQRPMRRCGLRDRIIATAREYAE
jgi:hypothetical protein